MRAVQLLGHGGFDQFQYRDDRGCERELAEELARILDAGGLPDTAALQRLFGPASVEMPAVRVHLAPLNGYEALIGTVCAGEGTHMTNPYHIDVARLGIMLNEQVDRALHPFIRIQRDFARRLQHIAARKPKMSSPQRAFARRPLCMRALKI
ncbi:hypothetical protein CHELA1G11_10126 [Hyphomicrobiales bacterium]|nr:hypothetical protein CHELA1G11_10126 [Hyphomicrobiales bacterium]CAH1676884.1 hypothetical protein CHELA1G2_14183 [Hyphomicrobiales bacterium]